jgi:hypothetical protein
MPKNALESDIPLLCTLCPKEPRFSDISHLLTHIASKSHLSHRFKLQIRASSEPDAKSKFDKFDEWYLANDLDGLLSTRMAAKDGKKSAKGKRHLKASNTAVSLRMYTYKLQLIELQVKKEEKFVDYVEPSMASTPVFNAPVPRMHVWQTSNAFEPSLNEFEQSPRRTSYATPSNRRMVPNFTRDDTEEAEDNIDPKLDTLWKPESASK